jgi:hypothetical protein
MSNMPSPLTRPGSGNATTIIATLARAERAPSLRRAIASVLDTNASMPTVIVVVNGAVFDPQLVLELENRQDVRVLRVAQPSLANAILEGRAAVQTAFFGFLDDDDEYLPSAIDLRLKKFADNPDADFVVTNGFRRSGGRQTKAAQFLGSVEMDPLASLFRENWLASCNCLFRTESVPLALFEDNHDYMEWTWLAFRLVSAGLKVRVIDEPTFVINDTPTSASKSPACLESTISLYQRLLARPQRPDIKATLKRRLSTAYHCLSDHQMEQGPLSQAWRHHFRSLVEPGGWRYLTFSARLLAASVGLRASRSG